MMNRYEVRVKGIGPTRAVHFAMPGKTVTLTNGCKGIKAVLSPSDALELAAWIVATVDPGEKWFGEIMRQIEEA